MSGSRSWTTFAELSAYISNRSSDVSIVTSPELCLKGTITNGLIYAWPGAPYAAYFFDTGEDNAEWRNFEYSGVIPQWMKDYPNSWGKNIQISVVVNDNANYSGWGMTKPLRNQPFDPGTGQGKQFLITNESSDTLDLTGLFGRFCYIEVALLSGDSTAVTQANAGTRVQPTTWGVGNKTTWHYENQDGRCVGTNSGMISPWPPVDGTLLLSNYYCDDGSHGGGGYWGRPMGAWTDWPPTEDTLLQTHGFRYQLSLDMGFYSMLYDLEDRPYSGTTNWEGYYPWAENFHCVVKQVDSDDGAWVILGNHVSNPNPGMRTWTTLDLVAGARDWGGGVVPGRWLQVLWNLNWGQYLAPSTPPHVVRNQWHPPSPGMVGGFNEWGTWPPYDPIEIDSFYWNWSYSRLYPARINSFSISWGAVEPIPEPFSEPTLVCEDLRPFGTICSHVIRERDIEKIKVDDGAVKRNSMWDGGDQKLVEDLVNGQEMQADRLHRHDKIYDTLDSWGKLWYKKTTLFKPQDVLSGVPIPPEEKTGITGSGGSIVGYGNKKFNNSLRDGIKDEYNLNIDNAGVDTIDEALWVLSWLMKGLRERTYPPVQETQITSGRLLNWTFVPLPNNNISSFDAEGNSLDGKWKDSTDVTESQCTWIVSPAFTWGLAGGALPWVYLCSTFGWGVGGDQADDFDFNPKRIREWVIWIRQLLNGEFFYGRWFLYMFFINWTGIIGTIFSILGLYGNYQIVGSHWWSTEMDATVMDHSSFWNPKTGKIDNSRKKMKVTDVFPPGERKLDDY